MSYLFKGLTGADETFDGSDLRILIVHARWVASPAPSTQKQSRAP